MVSTAYSTTLAATTSPAGDGVTWSLASGSGALPTGVTLGSDGAFSGTPDAGTVGSYPIIVRAADAVNGAAATQALTLTVAAQTVLTCTGAGVTPDYAGRKCAFSSVAANQTITVTAGAPTFTIKAWGAGGGGGGVYGVATGSAIAAGHGGTGGQLVASYAMGSTGILTVKIGGGGTGSLAVAGAAPPPGGWNGGGNGNSNGGSAHASSGAGGGSTELWNGSTRLLAVGGGTMDGLAYGTGGGAGTNGRSANGGTGGLSGSEATYAGGSGSTAGSYTGGGGGGGGWLGGALGSNAGIGGSGGGGGSTGVNAGAGVSIVEMNNPAWNSFSAPMGTAGSAYDGTAGVGGRGCTYPCSGSNNGNPGYMVVSW